MNCANEAKERGLLERVIGKLPDDNIYLYRLHPSNNIFAVACADITVKKLGKIPQ